MLVHVKAAVATDDDDDKGQSKRVTRNWVKTLLFVLEQVRQNQSQSRSQGVRAGGWGGQERAGWLHASHFTYVQLVIWSGRILNSWSIVQFAKLADES